MARRIGHLLVIIIGLVIFAYPLTFGAHPDVTCRGRVMQPGDVCTKADGSEAQSYEARRKTADNARPVIVIVGLLVAGFGVVLLRGELRTRPAAGNVS